MHVKMKKNIGGYRNGAAWPTAGGLIELPDHEAADMIANGYAEEATDHDLAAADQDEADPVDDQPAAGGSDGDEADPVDDQPAEPAGEDDTTPEPNAVTDEAPAAPARRRTRS